MTIMLYSFVFSVFRRGHPFISPEQLAEIGEIVIPRCQSHFRDGKIGFLQHLLRGRQPAVRDIFQDRLAGFFFKQAHKILRV